MKKLIFPFIIIAALFALPGCSTKFNIAAPYKNITVIYAYLDMADTAHYIRIQKAFLDQNKSALAMSQSADSSFYAHLNVKIKRMDFTDTVLFDTIHLNRVDLNLEGYPKQPGIFFTAPNYAYKFTNVLDPNYIYRIVVTNLATGQVDSSEAPVIDDNPGHTDPNTGNPYFSSNIFSDTGSIDFTATEPNKYFQFYCVYTSLLTFSFENQTSPAMAAEAILRFNWEDSNYITHSITPHYSDFDLGILTLTPNANTTQINYKILDTKLYDAVNSGLGNPPANTIRLMDRCDIFVYLGTQDFLSYLNNSLTQGVGLTGSEIEPVYTNIKGSDALGLFTSRGMRSGKLRISNYTMDSLISGSLNTRNNIKGRVN